MPSILRFETRRSKVATASLLSALVLSSPTDASQVRLTFEDLCLKSDFVVVATVESLKSYQAVWPQVGTITFTDVTLKVHESWKGLLKGSEVVVQVPGGRNPDGSVLHVSGNPRFRRGQKTLVFLRTYNGRLWVHGWEQGKYDVEVERVVGKRGMAIAEDTLTYPLKQRVERVLEKKTR